MRSEINDLAAYKLSQSIHKKQVSCAEVMKERLDWIDTVNPHVNAIVALQPEEGPMEQAAEKDSRLAQGTDDGWMHGFPLAIKDLEATAGILSTSGSPILRDFIPEADSLLVTKMKNAGCIITGKTNTPEFGYGSQTYNTVYGATGNPYNPELTSGGSSGGSACSIALCMQPVADGSDFMGSLRNPAGWCNVFGFRPSYGRVPSLAPDSFSSSFGVRGPMGRTIPDVAMLLQTLAEYSPYEPLGLETDPNLAMLTVDNVCEKLRTDVKGRKIAWMGDWNGYLPMEAGVLDICEAALKRFADIGVRVEGIKPFYNPEELWTRCWLPSRHYSASSLKLYYNNPETRKLLKPEAQFEYEGGMGYTLSDFYTACTIRTQFFHAMMKVFETYDYIAVPTAQVFAFDKNIHWPQEIAGRRMDTYHRWMEVVTHWTLGMNPVAAVPAGFDESGRSMGLQLVGRPRHDYDLLQFAYAYEQMIGDILAVRPELMQL